MRRIRFSLVALTACSALGCSDTAGVGAPDAAGGTGGTGANSGAGATSSSGGSSGTGGNAGAGGNVATAGTGGHPGAGNAGAAGSGGTAGTGGSNPDYLMHAHFKNAALGDYALADVEADFGAEPDWDDGLSEGRAAIEQEGDNQFLRVTFPADTVGPADGGVQFVVALAAAHEELFFAYRVRFETDFGFNRGGKLPGLVGGTSPTGCQPEETGFSARNMWRMGGAIVQYVYWPDQPNTCGDDLDYEAGGNAQTFTAGTWQTIEHRIVMNTPGQSDGIIQGWVDGELYLDDTARQWRKDDTFAIDALYFSTFFGGSTQDWASPREQSVDFDDLIVSLTPISH